MTTIRFRRNTSVQWALLNPVLLSGEPGFELDTGKEKRGDGLTRWNDLEYFLPESDVVALVNGAVAAGSRKIQEFNVPNDTWVWVHNLGCRPPVALFESSAPNEPVYTDVLYPDENTITVLWPEPTTGYISI